MAVTGDKKEKCSWVSQVEKLSVGLPCRETGRRPAEEPGGGFCQGWASYGQEGIALAMAEAGAQDLLLPDAAFPACVLSRDSCGTVTVGVEPQNCNCLFLSKQHSGISELVGTACLGICIHAHSSTCVYTGTHTFTWWAGKGELWARSVSWTLEALSDKVGGEGGTTAGTDSELARGGQAASTAPSRPV